MDESAAALEAAAQQWNVASTAGSDAKVSTIQQQHDQVAEVNQAGQQPGQQQQQSAQGDHVLGVCSRCKKTFVQSLDKFYRLCSHCRELQRERSKRWQMRTKEKDGVCRRCGTSIEQEEGNYVLCASCRLNLRARKSTRADQGKCVHCSGPNDSRFQFKVCSRCRQNDKIRRSNLERQGACNRCAQPLEGEDKDRKVCIKCRSRKRRGGSVADSDVGVSSSVPAAKSAKPKAEDSTALSHAAMVAAAAAVMANDQPISLENMSENIQFAANSDIKEEDHHRPACAKCGDALTIEDINLNPGSSLCNKCLESENNLFMNPEAEDITSKR